MRFDAATIDTLIQEIFGAVLQFEPTPVEGPAPSFDGESVAGVVQINGPNSGAVVVHLPSDLARRAAATMFRQDLLHVTREDTRDVAGELANIVGGNLKGLAGDGASLSLPAVADGSVFTLRVRGSRVALERAYVVDGAPFTITILERVPDAAASHPHHREWSRVAAPGLIEVVADGGVRIVVARARDLSMSGLYVGGPATLLVGTLCTTRIGGSADPESNALVEASGVVIRQDSHGFAVRFDTILGAESYEHLRNLLRYNAAEDVGQQMDNEFETHLGLRPIPAKDE